MEGDYPVKVWEVELAVDNGCYINVDSRFDAETITRVAEERSGVVQVQGVVGGRCRCWCASTLGCRWQSTPTWPQHRCGS